MKITFENTEYDYNPEYSFKDFTGQKISIPDGSVVYGSCFSQEIPDNHIFSEDMKGVTFVKCNLDNVFIPEGNTVTHSTQRRFKVQNDLNDWEIDENNEPVRPIDFHIYEKRGLEVPKVEDIPQVKVTRPVDLIKVAESKIITIK